MDNIQHLKPSLQRPQKRRNKRLDKELIECYRHGTRSKKAKGYNKMFLSNDFEHAHEHESIKFMHAGGTKYFNDNLGPLERLLIRRVGKNWNKLKSELCKQMDKSTVSGLHVFNHLYDYVYENTFVVNKIVYCRKYGREQELISYEKRPRFYVHHITGQLMKAPTERELRMKRRKAKKQEQ